MIYAKNISIPQTLAIPRTLTELPSGPSSLEIEGTVSKLSATLVPLFEEQTPLYHVVTIQLPSNMETGEYVYHLSIDSAEIACGLLQIGDYDAQKTEYEREIEYIEYGR